MKPIKNDEKEFSSDVVEWWVKWTRIHNKKKISKNEALDDLNHLQQFVVTLKNLYKRDSTKPEKK
ncbi:MAG: hypothetical protein VYD54_11480 [Bdellovibrionota bacterium]|nr:hypothetical protein [Bdellovibrionota bacterium]|tara:strand:+ start:133 stop:327 length:195 start_codon:yes stop_codon:yes gene_type:complete